MPYDAVGIGVVGVALFVGAFLGARGPRIHPLEQRVFRAINRWPGWLFYVLWAPMQLGNLVVGALVGLLVAWVLHDLGLAISVLVAVALKLAAERGMRRWLRPQLQIRQRPGTSEPDAILRGADVPTSGVSFPSGHVILVAAVGAVVWSGLPVELLWIPWALAVLVAVGRVYVGAHNPLDVVAGLGMGMAVGAVLDVVTR